MTQLSSPDRHRHPQHDPRCGCGDPAAGEPARRSTFTQGQYLTFRRDFDGTELRRNYSICAGLDDGMLAGRHQEGRWRRVFDLGQRRS